MTTRRPVLRALATAGVVGTLGTGHVAAQNGRFFVHGDDPAAAVRDNNGTVVHDYDNFEFVAARGVDPEKLRGDERVTKVTRDSRVQIPTPLSNRGRGQGSDRGRGQGSDITQRLTWGVNRIDAEQAWASGPTGEGVRIAVIDTGVWSASESHDDLAITDGYNALGQADNLKYTDRQGHGTHVAGTATALDNDEGVIGVAKDADLYAVKASAARYLTWTDIIDGVDWCMGPPGDSRRVDIVNMSFGDPKPSPEAQMALEAATEKGILFVAAAGNEATDTRLYPAAYDTVMGVGATSVRDDLTFYSNFGDWVEIAAPGGGADESASESGMENREYILSTWTRDLYARISGTSMAAPHVAGAAAVVWEHLGGDNQAVREQLTSTAEDVGLDTIAGGLVDVASAVGTDSSDNLPG